MVGQGKLIPPEEESYNHGARTCRVGKDGMLCVTVDQAHNVLPRDKLKLYDEVGIGGIVLMNAFDGSKREVFACGIRNSVGMAFYTGKKFPANYRGGFFLAQHDSWNRTSPIGARIMFTNLKADGSGDKTEVFAEGWLDAETRQYHGCPVDVADWPDVSILVSGDFAGAIYRISYTGP